jgi:hypothetical protein
LYEGRKLVGRFQIDSVKPAFSEVENWWQRTRDCARQDVLASLVSAKDLLTLEKPWDEGEVIRITAEFLDAGCFAYGSTDMAVFGHLWGHVERLKELITEIEGEEPKPESFPYPYVPPEQMRHGMAVVPPKDESHNQSEPKKAVRDCFERAAQFLKSPRKHFFEFPDFFQAEPYKLESNDDLIQVCNMLVEIGHKHPFRKIKSHVLESEWLDFLKWGKNHPKLHLERETDHLKGAYEWNHKMKGRPDVPLDLPTSVMENILDQRPFRSPS